MLKNKLQTRKPLENGLRSLYVTFFENHWQCIVTITVTPGLNYGTPIISAPIMVVDNYIFAVRKDVAKHYGDGDRPGIKEGSSVLRIH